ncbi:MAG: 3-methyl-2-oxobutanoate hydroxymethyltransferase [Planctomycetota bacterium]|nr:MAG: 3-methyl-2-oxobutanoate hydroxymethyltransferase [Planctomycetota bacterium]
MLAARRVMMPTKITSDADAPAPVDPRRRRVTLDDIRRMARAKAPFAMLTAYDYPTAAAAQDAGVPSLLIGDSMGSVVLGHESTRDVPLDLMLMLGEAVRRGAPHVFLVGDMPYEAMRGGDAAVVAAARRFRDEAGCDAVKIEATGEHAALVRSLVSEGVTTVAHLGLRPQMVESRDQLRAQARDADSIRALVSDARRLVSAGAELLLLEAVPNEAASAVVEATDVPVIGCGAGPACHGHVVVTHDMLGVFGPRVPRFVPVLADLGAEMRRAMEQYVQDIATRRYPAPQHVYGMRKQPRTDQPD